MKRIQIQLADDMVERLDKLAKSYGVSRSALCALYIGQVVDGTEKAIKFYNNSEVMSNVINKIIE